MSRADDWRGPLHGIRVLDAAGAALHRRAGAAGVLVPRADLEAAGCCGLDDRSALGLEPESGGRLPGRRHSHVGG